MGIVIGIIYAAKGIPVDEFETRIYGSLFILIFFLIVGFSFTMLGGFLSSFIAKHLRLLHAFFTGVLALLTGGLIQLLSSTPFPGWYNLLSFFLTIPVALLGGCVSMFLKKVDQPD